MTRNGLILGVLIAAIFALLSLGRLAMVSTETVQFVGTQATDSIASLTSAATISLRKADNLTDKATETANDQRRLMNVSTAAVARLIAHTDASLNCDTIGVMGHGSSAIDCRQLGVLVRAGAMIGNEDQRLAEFSTALGKAVDNMNRTGERLNVILSDDSIPRIQKALAEAAEHFDGTTVHLEAMSAEGQKGMTELAGAISDLRHPEKPPAWIRALGIMLTVLKATGQAAPLFK